MFGPITFFRTLFSGLGVAIVVYILIGVFTNTAPPHWPGGIGGPHGSLHSWVQYVFSVFGWPLGLWHPSFTFGHWTGRLCNSFRCIIIRLTVSLTDSVRRMLTSSARQS